MENLKQNISNLTNESDNRKMLLDSWKVFGRKKEDMFAYLEILENATKIIPGQTNAIQIFTLIKKSLLDTAMVQNMELLWTISHFCV